MRACWSLEVGRRFVGKLLGLDRPRNLRRLWLQALRSTLHCSGNELLGEIVDDGDDVSSVPGR